MAATKIKKRQIENLQIGDADVAAAAAIAISKIAGLSDALDSKEPAFTKNTAFNKNFGTTAGTVAEGDHTHSFSQLTDIPTTLAGFGIIDAFTKAEVEAITGDLDNLETTDKSNLVAALNEINGVVSDAVKPPLPIDCSGNPDYPAANKGDSYKVSVAGKIGGANGVSVEIGDLLIASVDTPSGDHAAVGSNWGIYQTNLDKATESVFGTGRIATTAEVTAGTNDQAWITPAKLAAKLSGYVANAALGDYYTKTNLQTSGQAQVHWGNITNVPGDLGVQTLSLGSNSGEISISGGNNIRLTDLFSRTSDSFDDFTRARGLFPYTYLSTATGYVGGSGGTGIRSNRSGTSYVGAFDIIAPSAGTPRLMFNVGSGAETWAGWQTFASEEWVTDQINTGTTLNSVLSNSAISSVVAQADNNFSINLKPPAEGGWDRWFGLWQPNTAETGYIGGAFGVYGSGNAGINYAYLVTDLNNTISNMGGRNSPGLRVYPTGQNGLRYYYDSSEKQVWHSGNLTPVDAAKYIAKEALAGDKDGTNKTFTLSNAPIAGKEMIFLNGQLLQSGSGADYTISGTTVTLTANQAAPVADDVILGTYIY